MSAERIHADDTMVPVLAKLKTVTGRIWTYVRDDRPFGGKAHRWQRSITRAVVPGSIRNAMLPAMWASCRPMPLMDTNNSTRLKGSRFRSLKWPAGATARRKFVDLVKQRRGADRQQGFTSYRHALRDRAQH